MNLKKFISGVSAVAIAASAFAAMAVTASATDYTNVVVSPVAQNRIKKNDDGTFTTDGNAGNQYALALADLSGLTDIDHATSVTISFSAKVPNGGRLVFGLGDKTVRGVTAGTSSKSTYDRNGIGMYFGSGDGTYFRINGGKAVTGAMGTDFDVTITLDRTTGKYSYSFLNGAITESNIATDVDNFTVVEAYTWLGNGTFPFSDVTVSYTVPEAPTHNYTINAVDGNGTVLSTIASGTIAEGYKYSADVNEVVEANGKYYQLDSSVTGYNVEYTMGNADATQGVLYNENSAIVGYQNAGHANAANQAAGYTVLGNLPAGNYKVKAYLKERGDRGIYIRNKDVNDTSANIITNFGIGSGAAAGVYEEEFTLTEQTTVAVTGYSTGGSTTKTNQSAEFYYVIVEFVSEYVPPVETTSAGFTFDSTIEKLAGQTVTLTIGISDNGVEGVGTADITDKFEGFSGDLMLAVIINDVPAGITITSATIEVE